MTPNTQTPSTKNTASPGSLSNNLPMSNETFGSSAKIHSAPHVKRSAGRKNPRIKVRSASFGRVASMYCYSTVSELIARSYVFAGANEEAQTEAADRSWG